MEALGYVIAAAVAWLGRGVYAAKQAKGLSRALRDRVGPLHRVAVA